MKLNELMRDQKSKKLMRSLLALTIFNSVIALFISLIFHTKQPFSMVWVFSMLIGFSINAVISLSSFLIWRHQEPNRVAFILICIGAAPVGYYIGTSIGLFLYNFDVPAFANMMQSGNRSAVIVSAFVSVFGGVFFWNQSQLAELKLQREQEKARTAAIEKQAMQAQLQLLQAQIEPHMLFNTLANLQGLIAIDTERAQHMLEQLIRYLRASLNSARTQKTTLKHEFELLTAYLELLAIRMGKRMRYDVQLPTELEAQQIAPMLLQPLVENAIKHGLEPKVDGGTISVRASLEQQELVIHIADTGLGLGPDYNEQHVAQDHQSHVGNANIRERLQALYGANASLTLRANQPCGVVAEIRIPMAMSDHATAP
ncbi:histidine kinase [Undibacterium cyanobacteriorum]|uniref:Histidine kinase n=1 Tax=Undibacterium cyanobacteriorum TaxID=3073561 RepID=A0ABY9REH0_9BURK|nr:histidine kinase [Undibacterium sp. 20NA77.5]WMW79628.1 histidine kinase [Undibacterium sp. 20NA77.5]